MTDDTIELRRRPGAFWAVCLVGAVALFAANFAVPHGHLACAALLPLALGLSLLFTRRKGFALRLEEDGIEVLAPSRSFIPYDRMEALCLYGDERDSNESFAFAIIHADGSLLVPADLTVPSRELFETLRELIPDRPRFQLPAALREYFREQRDLFGEERLFTYRAIPRLPTAAGGFGIVFSLLLIVVGIVWAATAEAGREEKGWAAAGGMAILVGFIWLLIAIVQRSNARRERGSVTGVGGLVVGPAGIALQQGETQGEMRWDEITHMSHKLGKGILLHFAGGNLTIRDIFDAPSREIYAQLRQYWRGSAYSGRE